TGRIGDEDGDCGGVGRLRGRGRRERQQPRDREGQQPRDLCPRGAGVSGGWGGYGRHVGCSEPAVVVDNAAEATNVTAHATHLASRFSHFGRNGSNRSKSRIHLYRPTGGGRTLKNARCVSPS